MADETDVLQDLAVDILCGGRYEPALARLLREPPGSWLAVNSMCGDVGMPVADTKAVAAWLPAPGEPDYAVVLFFDPDSLWSTTALYNTSRLLPAAVG